MKLLTCNIMPDIRPALIKAVKDRPALWNPNHPQFKMKLRHTELWNEVVAELPASPNINVETVKKQWKNMKDTYRKEIKRPYQQWCYCKEMSFIKQILIDGRRVSSPSTWIHNDLQLVTPDEEEEIEQNESQDEEVLIQDPFEWIPKRSNSFDSERVVVQEQEISIEHLKEDKNINNDMHSIQVSQVAETPKSEDYHFLMSILPEMEKLSPMQKMRLRTKINAALFEEMSLNYSVRELDGPTSAKLQRNS